MVGDWVDKWVDDKRTTVQYPMPTQNQGQMWQLEVLSPEDGAYMLTLSPFLPLLWTGGNRIHHHPVQLHV